MWNLFHMECRRLVRNRNFYLMAGITAGLLLLLIWLVALTSDPDALEQFVEKGEELEEASSGFVTVEVTDSDRAMAEEIRAMSQLDFAQECVNSGFLLVIVGIGTALFVSSDFQSGFIRNICFARPRRRDYVLSKILLAGIYSAVLLAVSLLIALLGPYLFGLHPAADSLAEILKYAFWLWLPHWAFGAAALALVLLTRSSTLAVVFSVVAGSGLLAAMVQILCQKFHWPALEQYLLSTVAAAQCVPMLRLPQMGFILACVLGWGAVYAAASLLLMEKRDI